jgi:hypothetical protein
MGEYKNVIRTLGQDGSKLTHDFRQMSELNQMSLKHQSLL